MNLRIMTLEARINELEKRIQKMEKGKEKLEDIKENITTVEEELMSIENCDALIDNEDKKLSTIKILARIKIEDYEIETLALVDSGCTRCIINKRIVPPNLIKTLDKPVAAMQMDGTHNIYKHYIDKSQISFINTCLDFYKPSYKVDKSWVRDLNINVDFVLGFSFMLHNNGSCLISRDGVIFFKNLTQTPVQTIETATRIRTRLNASQNNLENQEECCKDCKDKNTCCKDLK